MLMKERKRGGLHLLSGKKESIPSDSKIQTGMRWGLSWGQEASLTDKSEGGDTKRKKKRCEVAEGIGCGEESGSLREHEKIER